MSRLEQGKFQDANLKNYHGNYKKPPNIQTAGGCEAPSAVCEGKLGKAQRALQHMGQVWILPSRGDTFLYLSMLSSAYAAR